MIIDLEHHFSTEEQARKGNFRNFDKGKFEPRYDADGTARTGASWDSVRVEDHLEFMDKAGIDMAVLTTNFATNVEETRAWNDVAARVVKEHPKRFVAFTPAQALGGEPAFKEIERAIKDLGMKGVHISARVQGQHLDSRELWPFYEKVSELGVPIDVHISGGPELQEFLRAPYALGTVVAREYDMSAATLRVCLGGVLEDFPDLVFIMNHFGGGVSAVMERLDAYMNIMGPKHFYTGKPLISKPWREYFNKLYFSMAGREMGIATTKCALSTISPRKLMFGTDWTWNFERNPELAKTYIKEIRKLDLPKGDIEAMLGGNAAKLLGV